MVWAQISDPNPLLSFLLDYSLLLMMERGVGLKRVPGVFFKMSMSDLSSWKAAKSTPHHMGEMGTMTSFEADSVKMCHTCSWKPVHLSFGPPRSRDSWLEFTQGNLRNLGAPEKHKVVCTGSMCIILGEAQSFLPDSQISTWLKKAYKALLWRKWLAPQAEMFIQSFPASTGPGHVWF